MLGTSERRVTDRYSEVGILGKMLKLSHAQQMARDDANYEEAQSRLRMSMLCRDCVRPLMYPLFIRIVELAVSKTLR